MTRALNDKNRHPTLIEPGHDVNGRPIGKMGVFSINRGRGALQILECVPQLERQADRRRLGWIKLRDPSPTGRGPFKALTAGSRSNSA